MKRRGWERGEGLDMIDATGGLICSCADIPRIDDAVDEKVRAWCFRAAVV
jgi:hypothetical protein